MMIFHQERSDLRRKLGLHSVEPTVSISFWYDVLFGLARKVLAMHMFVICPNLAAASRKYAETKASRISWKFIVMV